MLNYFSFQTNKNALTKEEIKDEQDKVLYNIYYDKERFLEFFYNEVLDIMIYPIIAIYIIYKII